MNHYVYEKTNLINGKKYIGKRSCKCPIEEDKYMGSGTLLKRAIDKYGIENFTKEVLQVCNNEDEAYKLEAKYIENVRAYLDKKYYNISYGGKGFKSEHVSNINRERLKNADYKEKVSNSIKMAWSNPLVKEKMRASIKLSWTEERKQTISEYMKENAIQLPYGVRYDFIVEPDGCSLIHPEIQEIQLVPRPLSEWKKTVKEHCLEGTTMDVQLFFQKPFDVADNYLQLEIFDEALNWIAWSDYASDEGHINVLGFYPILDGEYTFVVLHNRTPFICGEFVCSDGICTVGQMTKWVDDKVLYDVLASRSHANDLNFKASAYGRRLRLLEDILVWEVGHSCLEGDYLDKMLAEQSLI